MNKKITSIKLQKFLLNALTERYSSDGCCPGITVSKLKNGIYYVSICRYLKPFGGEKKVIMKATAKKLTEALRIVAESWLKQNSPQSKSAYKKLSDLLHPLYDPRWLNTIPLTNVELDMICKKVITKHIEQAAAYKDGKTNLLGFFVAQAMKELPATINPKTLNNTMKRILNTWL